MINIINLILSIVIGVVIITLFMFTTAFIADILGDKTPRNSGRLSINPLKHIEPIGLILFVFFGYGWGKTLDVRAGNMLSGSMQDRKKGTVIVYGMPIVLSIVIAELLHLLTNSVDMLPFINTIVATFSVMFMKFAIANIIPIYPMNGSYILKSLLKYDKIQKFAENERLILIIFAFLLILGILSSVLNAVVNFLLGW